MLLEDKMLTIQQISRQLDIPKSTLRFWEKELGALIRPLRTNGGQRRYTPEHLERLKKINQLRQKGESLPQIAQKLTADQTPYPAGSPDLDQLADRIALLVKTEVRNYLR